jgi:hypothetical protein
MLAFQKFVSIKKPWLDNPDSVAVRNYFSDFLRPDTNSRIILGTFMLAPRHHRNGIGSFNRSRSDAMLFVRTSCSVDFDNSLILACESVADVCADDALVKLV